MKDKRYEGELRKHLQRRNHESVVTGKQALASVPNPAPKRREKNMYAIVEIAGKQFSVREKDRLIVPHLEGKANDSVTLDRVLLIAGKDGVQIGTPVVPDASVKAKILEHVKGDKILVFRKKRRKRFKVKRGHRQPYTRIEIGTLSSGDEKKPAAKKTAATKPAAKKTAAKKPAAKKTTASAKTAGAAQKTVKKKPAPKATEEAIPPESEAAS
ncbi:MAG: 50S ribosomal protein L21 [Bacteroidetes bacterium SB0662_bin_6]|nr:50S ribosomal protein L21 [Bacteroidetes bacterium SB0662_bin_6]